MKEQNTVEWKSKEKKCSQFYHVDSAKVLAAMALDRETRIQL